MRTLVLLAMRLTPKDLGRMARTTVIPNYDERSVRYEGVLLRDLLQLAGLGQLLSATTSMTLLLDQAVELGFQFSWCLCL